MKTSAVKQSRRRRRKSKHSQSSIPASSVRLSSKIAKIQQPKPCLTTEQPIHSETKNKASSSSKISPFCEESSRSQPKTFELGVSGVSIPEDIDGLKQEMNRNDKNYASLIAAKEESSKEVVTTGWFCFRKICILFDKDPKNRQSQMIRAMLDTGSPHTFIFECELKKLGLSYNPATGGKEFLSVTNERFVAIGTRQLRFKYRKIVKEHWVTAFVLRDPPEDQQPAFDILLGRDHLIPTGALVGNPEVIGTFFIQYPSVHRRQ